MAFITKQSGNGGACVSLARNKSTDQKKIVFGARESTASEQMVGALSNPVILDQP